MPLNGNKPSIQMEGHALRVAIALEGRLALHGLFSGARPAGRRTMTATVTPPPLPMAVSPPLILVTTVRPTTTRKPPPTVRRLPIQQSEDHDDKKDDDDDGSSYLIKWKTVIPLYSFLSNEKRKDASTYHCSQFEDATCRFTPAQARAGGPRRDNVRAGRLRRRVPVKPSAPWLASSMLTRFNDAFSRRDSIDCREIFSVWLTIYSA